MRTLLFLSVLLLINGCSLIFPAPTPETTTETKVDPAQTEQSKPTPEQQYNQLLSQLKSTTFNDQDIARLRTLLVTTSYYSVARRAEEQRVPEIIQSLNNKNWQRCQAQTEALLKDNYVSLMGHYAAMRCAQHTQAANSNASRHEQMVTGLINAILDSGTGLMPEQAFSVISFKEEYAFLLLNGMTPEKNAVFKLAGKFYDEMTVSDAAGKNSRTLYFDVSSFVNDNTP